MRLQGKKAVITGGNKGIGKAIALAFAKEGADILITYNSDPKQAEKACEELSKHGVQAYCLQLNLNIPDTLAPFIDQAIQKLGQIDICVNNAGYFLKEPFLAIPEESLDTMIQVNLTSPFLLIQKIAKHMIAKKIQGKFINISSISNTGCIPGLAHYEVSKAGFSMLTKTAAFNLAPYGIRVNEISPGLTITESNEEEWENNKLDIQEVEDYIPMGRVGQTIDHAKTAVFLASDDSPWMTGAELIIDGGVSTRL